MAFGLGRLKAWVGLPTKTPSELFSEAWGIVGPVAGPGDEKGKLNTAFMVGVTEWHRRRQDSEHNKWSFFAAQLVAPLAAATATVLAVSGVSKWAVIPSAIATVASSLLASFGLRENSTRLRLMTRELGFEIVKFAEGWGSYRSTDEDARIDLFIKRIDDLSIRSVFHSSKATSESSEHQEGA